MHKTTSTGQKIRIFRKIRNISQFELELLIGASPGTLSRIESGKVNPTKETLQKISNVLDLNIKDKMVLLGIEEKDPTEEEILDVKSELEEHFSKSEVFALLLDNRGNIILVSEGFYNFLPYTREVINKLIGKNLLEIIFDSNYGIADLLMLQEDTLLYEIVLFKRKVGIKVRERWARELVSGLSKFKSFDKLWKSSDELLDKYFTNEGRKIRIINNETSIDLIALFQLLDSDPRFEIIDYEPINES